MTIPVMVVTGFLGAGKTTFINGLLKKADGSKIAAIVNDFGAINIDEELISEQSDAVIGLANGCICCSLQGDLLRTLRLVLENAPELIIIEASGVADPRGILEVVSDRLLWSEVRLDSLVCLIDAADLAENPARQQDPLWQAQMQAASVLVLSKTAGLSEEALLRLRLQLSPLGRPPVVDPTHEEVPLALLSGGAIPMTGPAIAHQTSGRFTTLEWVAERSIALPAFQAVIEAFGAGLLRAKGVLAFQERPGRPILFQLVGQSVTMEPSKSPHPGCRLVFIGEAATLDRDALKAALDAL